MISEGKPNNNIFVTGNTAIDALKMTIKENYNHPIIDEIGNDRMILLTSHRRENLGKPMKNIFRAIKRIVDDFEDVQIVYPIHLNPKIRTIADEIFENFLKNSYYRAFRCS